MSLTLSDFAAMPVVRSADGFSARVVVDYAGGNPAKPIRIQCFHVEDKTDFEIQEDCYRTIQDLREQIANDRQ